MIPTDGRSGPSASHSVHRFARPAHRGGKEDFKKYGAKTMPGWSYRNMWWVSHNEHGAYAAKGIYGQTIYIDPTAEMVIARFGSFPVAANKEIDPTSLPAYHALAKHLVAHSD